MLKFINSRIAVFGEMPICNLNSERGFFIGSFCFPLCTRCTAIIFSILFTFIIIHVFKIKNSRKLFVLWVICLIPCLVDGIFQYYFGVESTNIKRFLTGVTCGVGIANLIILLLEFLTKKFNN